MNLKHDLSVAEPGARTERHWLCAVSLAIAILTPGALFAADFGDRTPSVEEFIDALDTRGSIGARPDGVRTRGLKMATTEGSGDRSAANGKSTAAGKGRVSMSIQFDLNSDRVLRPSADTLSNLAAALNSEALKDRQFQVIGHTDVSGSVGFNFKLSERRARSVAEFLSHVGVDPVRAKTEGRGPTELLDGLAPTAAQHRRVEIKIVEQ